VKRQYQHPGFFGLAGAARVEITPPPGIYARNWGAARHDAAEGVHRPLFVTALALAEDHRAAEGSGAVVGDEATEGAEPLLLLEADLGWWRSPETERRFRESLLAQLGLAPERLVFALTHTHAAPPLVDRAEPGWEGGELLQPWLERVREGALAAADDALASLRPAALEWRYGRCGLATARDLADPDRPGRFLCGFDPGSPADDTLLVGRVAALPGGEPLATIVNYACHPTTLAWENRLISPDFVGAMRETVESSGQEGLGGGLTLFLQGASGELSPRRQYVGDPAVADGHGRELGHAVLSTLAGMEAPGTALVYAGVEESGAPLAQWLTEGASHSRALRAAVLEIELPLKDWPSAAELERALAASGDRVEQERLRRRLAIRRGLGDGDRFPLPVWIWQLGDALLVANMAEAYSRIQRRLRAGLPGTALAYCNLANGSVGYLPPAERYGDDLYQAWQTPFARGSLEALEEALAAALPDFRDSAPAGNVPPPLPPRP